jgi:hypothetical protein
MHLTLVAAWRILTQKDLSFLFLRSSDPFQYQNYTALNFTLGGGVVRWIINVGVSYL